MTDPDVRVIGQHNHLPEDTLAMCFARFEQATLGHWDHSWREQARKIFYAGFGSCLSALGEQPGLSDAQWQVYCEGLQAEMGRYIATVMAEAEQQKAKPDGELEGEP